MENSGNVRIASSNIRFENPADGINDWSCRRELWAKLINEFEPYLLGTQEGREAQLINAAGLLTSMELVDSHRDWIEERMYPCIFYNPNYVEIMSSGDAWLSNTPEVAGSKSFSSAFPRLCTWCVAKIRNSNKKLFFINTHLDHVKSETRAKQIQVLIDTVKTQNQDNYPIILTGDFNEDPYGEVRASLNARLPQLVDPWLEFEQAEQTSHHKFCGVNEQGARIDWILASKDFSPVSIELDKRHEGDVWPSDHFIVKAEFKY